MSISQKFFRKFYYENSGFIDSETVFFETTNEMLLPSKDIMALQNNNKYSTLQNNQIHKIFNLEMEIKTFPTIDLKPVEVQFAK